ncbi:MAG: glycosyltransferase [Actinomycetota bacterium]
MNVFIFSPSLPLPFGTADARWLWVVCSELSRRGIDVGCLSCTEERSELVSEAEKLSADHGFRFRHVPLVLNERVLARKARSLRRPFSEFARVSGLAAAIAEERAGADIVHVEHLYPMWAFEDDTEAFPYVHYLGTIDWELRRGMSLRDRVTSWQMGRATRRLLSRTEVALAMTPRLATAVRAINSGLRSVQVVPMAIDPRMYEVFPVVHEPVVGVIGSMHWYPSRSAAERVLTTLWPQIRERVPAARLLVAGWNAEKYLGNHFPVPGAELLGEVAHPREFFSRIGVLLYPPARGSGMKVKVLEAMAYGVPVVSNGEGLEGLEPFEKDGVYARGETDAELIDLTVALLEDAARRRDTAARARRLIASEYSPSPAVDRLLAAYEAGRVRK